MPKKKQKLVKPSSVATTDHRSRMMTAHFENGRFASVREVTDQSCGGDSITRREVTVTGFGEAGNAVLTDIIKRMEVGSSHEDYIREISAGVARLQKRSTA